LKLPTRTHPLDPPLFKKRGGKLSEFHFGYPFETLSKDIKEPGIPDPRKWPKPDPNPKFGEGNPEYSRRG